MTTKILLVGNDVGYFYSHRLPLARFLADNGVETHVAAPFQARCREDDEPFVRHRVPFARASLNPLTDLISFAALSRLYRRLKPDLVHHFTIKPILYGSAAARLNGVPAVVNALTGRGYLFTSRELYVKCIRVVASVALARLCAGEHVRTILQNPDDQEYLVERGICSKDTSVVIRGSGVDPGVFRKQPKVDDGRITVVFAGRLLWEKGVREFVEAARHLKSKSMRFVLVGGGDPNPGSIPERTVREWCSEGVVEWWGRRDDMVEVYREADIVCLPSSYGEGVPKVLIEAASCGRALVTTNIPGCREIVRDRWNGLLVPPGSVPELVTAIRQLAADSDLRRQMGDRGRDLVLSEFSLEVVIKRTIETYAALGAWP